LPMLLQQVQQEHDHIRCTDSLGEVLLMNAAGQTQAHNRRQFAPLTANPSEERWLTARRPGTAEPCPEREADFIDEHDHCALSASFFLMRGQSCFNQASTSSSSCSKARATGSCTLQPRSAKRRLNQTVLYDTWTPRWTTRWMRGNVQRSLSKPARRAPRFKIRSKRCQSEWLNCAGRPDTGRAAKPRKPRSARACFQRVTAARLTPNSRAIAAWLQWPA